MQIKKIDNKNITKAKRVDTNTACNICNKNDWVDLDYLRMAKENFVICNNCGFVTYLIENEKKLEMMYKNHLHNPARAYSGSVDDSTKQNKLCYHRRMLNDVLKSKPNQSILDFGCSTGYILKMAKDEYGHNDLTGIELNKAHAEYGKGEFGLDIKDEGLHQLKKGKKYDLIIVFAVLEHLLNPVDKMKEFKKLLTTNGKLYLMVPLWFNTLLNSNKNAVPFEQLFVPHHVNCFSKNHINNVFGLSGFKVNQYNNTMYGHMFILDQCEINPKIVKDDSKKIISEISTMKKSLYFTILKKWDAALEHYSNNPFAWIGKAETQFKADFESQLKCIETCLQIDPSYTPGVMQMGEIYMRANDFVNSIKWHIKAINMSPTSYQSYFTLAQIFYIRKQYKESIKWCNKLIEVNPEIKNFQFHKDGHTIRNLLGMNYTKK